MKKKVMAVILASAMAMSLLSGCGNSETQGAAEHTSDVTESAETAEHTSGMTESAETAQQTDGESGEQESAVHGEVAEQVYFTELPTAKEQADIFVEKIDGLPEDFIKGIDISSLLAEEASGVKYYDSDGKERDLFEILADAGVNYIRVRVWNDPFDENGNGYGGGNCTAETAAELGRRAAQHGMKINVDFHYSDFWADPSKQMVPKAWKDMDIDTKADALYEYTKESLKTIFDAGADVGIVQIGNETNYGVAGEKTQTGMMKLFKKGAQAVRDISGEYERDVKIAVHFTNVDNPDQIAGNAAWVTKEGLDYDIFGLSYYYYWHDDLENLKEVMLATKETTGKEVCILETAWPWTGEDGDSSGNSIGAGDVMGNEYRASVQSQATFLRDLMAVTNEVGALGTFYWEGAWVPVGHDYESNAKIWEQYGSGWASKYAADYDPNDAGKYYGGCSWDNQAFFDFDGHKLPSLDVYRYVNYGADCPLALDFLTDGELESPIGAEVILPEGVLGVMNDRSQNQIIPVKWDAGQVASLDPNKAGDQTVYGKTEDGQRVKLTVRFKNNNLLQNGSFEDADSSMWVVSEGSTKTDIQTKSSDAKTGDNAFHFWDTKEQYFIVTQTVQNPGAGEYAASAYFQGGDVGNGAEIYLFVQVGDQVFRSEPVTLTGWVEWQWPVVNGIPVQDGQDITVGFSVSCASGGWGTIDDVELYKTK